MRIIVACSLALVAVACGAHRPAPVGALQEYSAALERGDYDDAYGMMSEEFRQVHSKEEFVRLMKENDTEVSETAARLKGDHDNVEVTARFRYGIGDSLDMVYEGGRWRIASNPIAFYSQQSPRDALRSFVRAYRLKRWDVILELIPGKYADQMTVDKVRYQFEGPRAEDVELMMQRLEQNIDAPIREKGNEARMSYHDAEVKFVREDGAWKIQDPD